MKKTFISIGAISMIMVPVIVVVSVIPQDKIIGRKINNRTVKQIYLSNLKGLSQIKQTTKEVALKGKVLSQEKMRTSNPVISNASLSKNLTTLDPNLNSRLEAHIIHSSIKYTFDNSHGQNLPPSNSFGSYGSSYTFNRVMDVMLNIEKNHEDIVTSDKEKELLEASYKYKKKRI